MKEFSIGGKLYEVLIGIKKMLALNILFLLGCLPIFTIGVSLTAMYSVIFKIAKKEDSYIWNDFWRAYKENFKQGVLLCLIFLGVGCLVFINKILLVGFNIDSTGLLQAVNTVILFLSFVTFVYIFPVLARFDNKISVIFQTSIYLSIRHFNPIILLVSITPVLVMLFLGGDTAFQLFPIVVTLGFSGAGYINNHFFNKIFNKYVKGEREESI